MMEPEKVIKTIQRLLADLRIERVRTGKIFRQHQGALVRTQKDFDQAERVYENVKEEIQVLESLLEPYEFIIEKEKADKAESARKQEAIASDKR